MRLSFKNFNIPKIKNKISSIREVVFHAFKKRKKTFLAVSLLLVFIAVGFFYANNKKVSAAWWNDSWAHRKAITVNSNGNSNLTDFQVSFILDTATLITNQKLQGNCNDLRVTDVNGKLIPFWVEEGVINGCNTTNTKIWTKVPIINSANSNIFVYYGNSTAMKAQDGNSTFEFFDDFSINQVDTNTNPNGDLNTPNDKWVTGNVSATLSTVNYTVGSGLLSGGNTNKYVESKRAFTGNYAIETRVHTTTLAPNGYTTAGFNSSGNSLGILEHNATSYFWNSTTSPYWFNFAFNGNGQWSKDVVKVVGTSGTISRTGETSGSYSTSITHNAISGENIRLGVRYDGYFSNEDYSAQWDWFIVRKAVATDPTTTVDTTEQYTQGPIQYFKFDEGYGVAAKNSAWQKFSATMNLILNPSFENAAWSSNWTVDGTNFTTTSSQEQRLFGFSSAKSIKTATNTDNWTLFSSNTLGASGYFASAYIYIPSGGGVKSVCISDQSFTGTSVCTDDTKRDQWQRISTFFSLASTTSGLIVIRANGFATNEYFYQDGFQLEPVGAITPYCDGSVSDANGNHSWAGTANASVSNCDVGSDGIIYGTKWKSEDQCVSGKCLSFNGTASDYITVPVSNINLRNTQGITTSVWLKSTDVSQNQTILSQNGPFFMYMTGGLFNVGIYNGNWQWLNGTTALKSNTWYNFSLTYDGSTVRSYINGKLEASLATTGSLINGSSNMYMGYPQAAGVQYPIYGTLDEVKVYGYARSAAQILLDYNAIANEGASASFGGASQKWLSDNATGFWKLDGNSTDASGNGSNGTDAAMTYSGGRFGNAGIFSGTGTISFPSKQFNNVANGSISFWMKPTSTINNSLVAHNHLLMTDSNLGSDVAETNIYMEAGTGKLVFAMWNGSSWSTEKISTTQSSWAAGVWNHVVATWGTGGMVLYVNGINVGTYNSTRMPNDGNGWWLGSYSNQAGSKWNGAIDDLRTYNRAISSQEAAMLYSYAPGPVGYWNFDENKGIFANDTSGNNNTGVFANASVSNPGWSVGKIGSGINLPNTTTSTTEINAGIGSSLDFTNTTNFTVGTWLKRTTKGSGTHVIAVKGDVASDKYWDFFMDDSGYAKMQMKDGTLSLNFSNSTNPVAADGKWHYVAATVDHGANKVIIYVDGIAGSYDNFGTPLNNVGNISVPTFPLRIGNWGVLTNYGLSGYMDDFKIYNYVRTPEQIMQDMGGLAPNAGVQSSKEAIGYWKFDEGNGTVVNNSAAGGPSGTLTCAGAGCANPSWTNNSKSGKALYFSGVGAAKHSYINIPYNNYNLPSTVGSTMSFSMWVNPDLSQTASGLSMIFRNGFGFDENYGIALTPTPVGGKFAVNLSYYDGTSFTGIGSGYFLPAAQLSNLTVTISQGNWVKFYLNGALIEQDAWVGGVSVQSTSLLGIGGFGNFAQYFNGYIDELKIFNYELSATDIATDYNQGSAVKMSGTGTLTAGGVSDSGSAEYCVPGDVTSCNPPLGDWKFDENKGNTVADSSGNNNNGTWATSNAAHWTAGKISGGGLFTYKTSAQMTIDPATGLPNDYNSANDTTTTDYVSTPITADPTSFTVSAWAKWNGPSAVIETIASKFASGPFRGFYLRRDIGSTMSACVWNTGTIACVPTPPAIEIGKWNYWTMSFNGSTIYLYKNGVLASSGPGTMSAPGIGIPFMIGVNYGAIPSEQWNGDLDQVRYYNYARTPAQIAYDYNRGGPVGWWKMDECQGNILNDASGNGNIGTLTVGAAGSQTSAGTCTSAGTAWGNGASGKFGSSLNLDGTSDYIDIAQPMKFSKNSFTVSSWVNVANANIDQTLLSEGAWGGGGRGWNVGFIAADAWWGAKAGYINFNYQFVGNGTVGFARCDFAGLLNKWVNVVAIKDYSAQTMSLYLNGVRCSINTFSDMQAIETDDLQTSLKLGRDSWASSEFLNGKIDDVRAYNYALTKEQIANVMNEGSALRFGN